MFRTQNLCPGSKNVFDSRQKHFLFSEQQNLFPQNMFPRAAKLGNICIRNNVSATMFPSLARPLDSGTRTTTSTRFSHGTTESSRKPASFWQEKLDNVIIFVRGFAKMLWCQNKSRTQ